MPKTVLVTNCTDAAACGIRANAAKALAGTSIVAVLDLSTPEIPPGKVRGRYEPLRESPGDPPEGVVATVTDVSDEIARIGALELALSRKNFHEREIRHRAHRLSRRGAD